MGSVSGSKHSRDSGDVPPSHVYVNVFVRLLLAKTTPGSLLGAEYTGGDTGGGGTPDAGPDTSSVSRGRRMAPVAGLSGWVLPKKDRYSEP